MHDVAICGAGPAGSVVAQRLAAAGLRVALVGGAARPGWEGLSSRSHGLLMEEGVDPQGNVIAGPFVRRGVWANGRSVDGVEWLVERAALADALSTRARERGADYRADTVTSTTWVGDHWRAVLRGGEVLRASMMVDARGRWARSAWAQSSLPQPCSSQRNELPRVELLRGGTRRSGPVLLAIGQRFYRRGAAASGTGIGVTDTAWCWWAERGDSLWVQIIGKPRSLHPTAWVATAAAQIPALARALEGASPEGAPVARAAHAQLSGAPGAAQALLDGAPGCDSLEPSFWLAGDAAMALDPLSGQGVYEAVRGARLVATATQSVTAGGDARVAQGFVAVRREHAWLHGVRMAAGFYRENESCGSFWSETAAAYEALLPERASAMSGLRERGPLLQRDLPRVSSGG
jgi:2-polyprenyl-6-methoxyphenol hydroxylase-like FAD-dependent oxidoreductase